MIFASLTTLAIIVSLVRFWLLPEIDQFRHQLEAIIAERLHQPVRIGKLRASLYQFKPQLRLLGVSIGNPAHPLQLQEIQVVVDTLASLKKRDLAIESIQLLGARIDIERTLDGQISIRGLGNNQQGLPPWLAQDGRFELIESTLSWHFEGQSALKEIPVWNNVNILLNNHANEHQLKISFHAPAHWARQALLHIHFVGNLQNPRQSRGHFLLNLQDMQVQSLQTMLSPLLPQQPWVVIKGQGDLNMTGRWQSREVQANMELSLDDMLLQDSDTGFPVSLQRFDASIHGRLTPTGWHIDSPYLRLKGKGLEVTSRVSLNKIVDQPTDLDCFAMITRLDLAALLSQLPPPTNPKLAQWIAMQPFKGSLTGNLLWRGRIADYPFKLHNGTAEARLSGHHLTIRFLPDWPALEQADLRVTLLNDQVRLDLDQTRFAGNTVGPASGKLELGAANPVLSITTRNHLKLPRAFAALRQTPLKPAIDNLNRYTDIEGFGHLALRIDIPLLHARHTKVQGEAIISSAKIRLRNTPYFVNDVEGKLTFDRNLFSTQLEGKFNLRPAQITANADKQHFDINILTSLGSDDLPRSIPAGRYIQGISDIDIHVVKQKNRPAKLSVQSDLQGMAIKLPRPVGKPAISRRSLSLSTWLTDTDVVPLNLDYGPLHAFITLDKKIQVINGRIGINQPPPSPTRAAKKGLIVKGRLERIDPFHWFRMLHQTEENDGTNRPSIAVKQLDLDIGHLTMGASDLGRFRFTAQEDQGDWAGQLGTPYGLAIWRNSIKKKQLTITFDRLDFGSLTGFGTSSPTDDQGLSFAHWPVVHLNAHHLDYQEEDLGRLEIRATPRQQTLDFDLKLAAPTHRLDVSGSWTAHPAVTTHVKGRLTSPSLGDFLKRINHPTALVGSASQIDFDLDWNAPPYHFSLKQLNGHLKLSLGAGRWLDVEPGAGRLFGLLYLGTLGRRLRLDFSDLFTSGLSYDRISGHIRMANGRAFTDDLMIEAVSARIYINGSVDLAARRTDELITVIPNTPLTLGLLPEKQQSQLGKAASHLQNMINTPLDSITQSQYAITGTWDAPVIVRLRRSVPGTIMHGIWSGFKQITGNHKTR